MRIVAALGGNALMRRGDKPDARTQIANVQAAAKQLARERIFQNERKA